jgi:fido (protein-threonine AMPylation protein)
VPLDPDYGETPVSDDDLAALQPAVHEALGEIVLKADIFDLEQALQTQVTEELLGQVLDRQLNLDDLLHHGFARQLHERLYKPIWAWGGRYRERVLSIGVMPELIVEDLHTSLGSILYRWQHTADWGAQQLGIAVHAETVRIHPFTDGNGRTTRMLADLVLAAASGEDGVQVYDWDLDKPHYVRLLREFDGHRNPVDLAAFVRTLPL